MGVIIQAVAVSQDSAVRGSIAHAARAGRDCVSRAGVALQDIGMLINTGVYRDDNLVEPAMAALIQREIGFGLDFTVRPGEAFVISFDLMNGACGLLNATQVAGAFLKAGGMRHVLLVTSDAHPGGHADPEFPFARLGGAMLLSSSDDEAQGFGPLSVRGSMPTGPEPETPPGVAGFVRLGPLARGKITVTREPGYETRLGTFAAEMVHAHIDRHRLDVRDTLLITSQPTPDFGEALAVRLGLRPEQALRLAEGEGEPHSAALALGFHQATERGLLHAGKSVLFVAAGAGLSCACAAYRC